MLCLMQGMPPSKRNVVIASSRAVREQCSCRINEWAEGWLATEQRVLGGRLFGGILLGGLVYRHYRQPVAFGCQIDRNGNARCVVGAD